MKTPITWMLIICLVPFLTGCEGMSDHTLTGRLWDDETGPVHFGPSSTPHLALFQDTKHRDILVEYYELSGKDGTINRRAYLFEANQKRIDASKKPHFIDLPPAGSLESIPLETNSPPALDSTNTLRLRAYVSVDGTEFTLVSNGAIIGPCHLPIYSAGADHFDRMMLTPVTVVGDVVIYSAIAAAIVGVAWLIGAASSNGH